MQILHIAGGLSIQKLYINIFQLLSEKEFIQDVYVPCNSSSKLGSNETIIPGVNYSFFSVSSYLARVLFFPKVFIHYKQMRKHFGAKVYKHCFAYTVMTDGALAYRLYKKHDISYSVFVRNTDINIHYKYFFWLRPYFHRILMNAKCINFPNLSYKDKMLRRIPRSVLKEIAHKVHIVPNGIDEFWHNNYLSGIKIQNADSINVLFVGKIDENKNVKTLIKAVELVNRIKKCNVVLIGSISQSMEKDFENWKLSLGDSLNYKGIIEDKELLLIEYRKADIFVMPSLTETFGLVYIEALTQGLPIIYTKGEGVSGFFDNTRVGLPLVDPMDAKDIKDKILFINDNFNNFSCNTVYASKRFNWQLIIKSYLKQVLS